MNITFFGCALSGLLAADPEPLPPPTPERIKELVKKLEEPTRHERDPKQGPPDGAGPLFDYRWHGEAVAELKRAGEVAVPAMFALLEDKSKPGQARAHAAAVLIERVVGTKVKPDPKVIAAVNAALKDKDPSLRQGVLFWLMRRGLANNREIWEKLKNDKALAEVAKTWLLPEERSFTPEVMDAFLPEVIAALSDKHPEVAVCAAGTINWFGRPKSGVPELIAALGRKEPSVQAAAALALGRVGIGNQAALKAVLELLDSGQPLTVYGAVIYAVGQFGPDAKAAVPKLIEALKDDGKGTETNWLRDNAVIALGHIGPNAKAAVPALVARIPTVNSAGSREDILVALDRIDSETGKKVRADVKRQDDEYQRHMDAIRNHRPPPLPPPVGKQ